jgi:hypothetical protein
MIMHSMIGEDKCDEGLHDQVWKFYGELVVSHSGTATFEEVLYVHQETRTTHDQLQADLIEHHWVLIDMARINQ